MGTSNIISIYAIVQFFGMLIFKKIHPIKFTDQTISNKHQTKKYDCV